ncbi:MAG TPA: FKBP-type peptidyl-prolyl cis-trans isomerase [Pedobacter sp.]|nr:FKBP-type peptidyl-prolyl cis-trans isomerase [Pedobacter sp.]
MKKIIITALLPLCALAAHAQATKKAAPAKKKTTSVSKTSATVAFKNNLDSASYAFGTSMAGSLKSNGLTSLNYPLFLKGIQDAFGGKPLLISADQSQSTINNAFRGAAQKKFAPVIAEGKAFLENNRKQPGVQVTPSGIQYIVLTKGTGLAPKSTDTVTVHYKGTLLNGQEFDSSYKRNEPTTFPLDGVIRGWTEGVQLMQTGAKYKFFIPYDLAYGERAAGPDIPPYSTLVFEIELLKVNGK